MLVRTARLSSKGQLTLPAAILQALHLTKGSELVVLERRGTIVLVPSAHVAALLEDELSGFEALALPAFADVWDNPEDEIWNDL